jgi:starch synthase
MSEAAMKSEMVIANVHGRHFPARRQLPDLHAGKDLARKKILFVTPEYAGLIKAGGLGDVSAALPKALSARHDVRVLIPGYRQIMTSQYPINIVARLEGYAGLPACKIGQLTMDDGYTIYVVVCPELYEREGSPYGDAHGQVLR